MYSPNLPLLYLLTRPVIREHCHIPFLIESVNTILRLKCDESGPNYDDMMRTARDWLILQLLHLYPLITLRCRLKQNYTQADDLSRRVSLADMYSRYISAIGKSCWCCSNWLILRQNQLFIASWLGGLCARQLPKGCGCRVKLGAVLNVIHGHSGLAVTFDRSSIDTL